MIIYIDNDYKCYVSNSSTMTAVEVDFFNNKCAIFIEGYRYIPTGETWTREDGVEFKGEMIAPWKNYAELEKAQLVYEKEQAEEVARILLGENE
jgi:hypothetical protein